MARKNSTPDLSTLSDRELLLYVHQDLSAKIEAAATAVLTEVEGVRVAVVQLAPLDGKVDALITDVRQLAADNVSTKGQLKLAHTRVVELEAASGNRRARR